MNSDLKKRNAEVLKKWLDGAEIQVRSTAGMDTWHDMTSYVKVHGIYFDQWKEFRLKPKTVKYRVALLKIRDGNLYTIVVNTVEASHKAENDAYFVRWLTDWQEVSEDDPNS